MLTLVGALSIEGFTVYQDENNDLNATPRSVVGFYALPGAPRIALDAKGQPLWQLSVYRRSPEEGRLDDAGFGVLRFSVEATPPDLDRIRAGLSALGYAADVPLSTVTFTSAQVQVAIAGEHGDADGQGKFVKRVTESGKADGVWSAEVDLTMDGASLLDTAQKSDVLPVSVAYRFAFAHRLTGATLHAVCDGAVCGALLGADGLGAGGKPLFTAGQAPDSDTIQHATDVLMKLSAIRLEVVPGTSALSTDDVLILQSVALGEVSRRARALFADTPLPADSAGAQKFAAAISAALNFSLDHAALSREYGPAGNLRHPGAATPPVAFVDLTIPILKLPVRVNADFTTLPIDRVEVTVTYRGAETTTGTFVFRDGDSIQTFEALTDGAPAIYDWSARIFYKDPAVAPFEIQHSRAGDRALIVDVGTLGLIDVDVFFGLVDLHEFKSATVALRYDSKALGHAVEGSVTIDAGHLNGAWIAPIGEACSGNYQYRVDWVRGDGVKISQPWAAATVSHLRVDGPLGAVLNIAVLATGDFTQDDPGNTKNVTVSLRYRDPDHQFEQNGTLVLTDSKLRWWAVDLADPARTQYQYRYTVLHQDGATRSVPAAADQWLDGPPGFLSVGDQYDLQLTVYPYLLKFDGKLKSAQVDLAFDDAAHNVHLTHSFTFDAQHTQPRNWHTPTGVPDQRTVTATITWTGQDGATVRGEPVTTNLSAWVPIMPDAYR